MRMRRIILISEACLAQPYRSSPVFISTEYFLTTSKNFNPCCAALLSWIWTSSDWPSNISLVLLNTPVCHDCHNKIYKDNQLITNIIMLNCQGLRTVELIRLYGEGAFYLFIFFGFPRLATAGSMLCWGTMREATVSSITAPQSTDEMLCYTWVQML